MMVRMVKEIISTGAEREPSGWYLPNVDRSNSLPASLSVSELCCEMELLITPAWFETDSYPRGETTR